MYTDAPEAISVVQSAFPYRHSPCRLRVESFNGPIRPDSYWSGGTKDYWAFVRLSDLKASSSLPESGSGFGPESKDIEILPEGFALVKYTDGNFTCATVYVHESNLTPFLPPSVDLSEDEEVVLACTARLKSGYRKESAARKWGSYTFNKSLEERWNKASDSLKARGLIGKNGAVTTDGKNRAKDSGFLSRY